MTATPVSLLPAIELETGNRPTHTVLWMHGLGADGHDFVPVVDELALPSSYRVRFLFPHAPSRTVSINHGMVMPAWYDFDIAEPDAVPNEDAASLYDSQHAIEALIARETQRGIPSGNIVLAGFSQGGALALQTGLRYGKKLAGIMALSSYLPLPQTLAAEAHAANASTPIFMAHGEMDNVIPMMVAAATRRQLLEAGYAIEWHQYRMAHSVCAEEIADIRTWLKRILA